MLVMTDVSERPADPLAHLGEATRAYRAAQQEEALAKRQAERSRQRFSERRAMAAGERQRLAEAIVAAARGGQTPAEIRRITGYTRERIRQICRGAGITPAE